MRERAFTTAVVWIAAMVGINLLVNSLRYTEYVANPNYVTPDLSGITNLADMNQIMPLLYNLGPSTIAQTIWSPSIWVIAAVILMAMIVIAAGVSTLAMWVGRGASASEQAAAERAKTKRHDREREARVRRLLDTMDDDELAALEAGEIGEDGERVTMEALLRRQ